MNLTIGQLAKRTQINIETVRYYERRGLIPKPPVTASGYRQYAERDVKRVELIRRAQALGFSLAEIQELLELRVDPDASCADVKRRALQKIEDIDGKIASLTRMKQGIERLAASCRGRGPTSECPILDALERMEEQ